MLSGTWTWLSQDISPLNKVPEIRFFFYVFFPTSASEQTQKHGLCNCKQTQPSGCNLSSPSSHCIHYSTQVRYSGAKVEGSTWWDRNTGCINVSLCSSLYPGFSPRDQQLPQHSSQFDRFHSSILSCLLHRSCFCHSPSLGHGSGSLSIPMLLLTWKQGCRARETQFPASPYHVS